MDMELENDMNLQEKIDQLKQSFEFRQMVIYKQNFKFEKSLALVDQIFNNSSEFKDPRIQTFLLKIKYEMQILSQTKSSEIMEAEITLLNHSMIIEQHKNDYTLFSEDDYLQIQNEILLHYMNHNTMLQLGDAKMIKQC